MPCWFLSGTRTSKSQRLVEAAVAEEKSRHQRELDEMKAEMVRQLEAQKEEFVLWAEAIQEMAVHIKADKNWMPFEFGVRPTQLVDHDPDGSYVPLDS